MDANLSTTTVEPTDHPNTATIQGLREVAAWLEQHPELPPAHYTSVSFGYSITRHARERLTQLAEALGDRAEETRYTDTVTISGQFDGVRVYADAKARDLVGAPPVPDPEPILPVSKDLAA